MKRKHHYIPHNGDDRYGKRLDHFLSEAAVPFAIQLSKLYGKPTRIFDIVSREYSRAICAEGAVHDMVLRTVQ